MNRWATGAVVLFFVALVAGCGSNKTAAGITITASSTTTGANSVTVPVGGTEQFAATVTGVSVTTVYWQVCLPTPVSNLQIPTTCTAIPGVTARPGSKVLTGYGSIDQNGFYTAPAQIPNPNSFVILATSPVDLNAFATFTVTIDSGIRVQVTPKAVTIGSGDTEQFTATVTGTSNTSVTWEVNGTVGGDPNNGGTITPGGLYTAPATGTSAVTIRAISGADNATSGSATVTIVGAAPTLTAIEPQVAGQGSSQQEVYLEGTNFTSNGSVLVNGTPVPFVFLSTSLVRAIIPASELTAAGSVSLAFQMQPIPPQVGQISNTENLTVVPVRPSIVAYSPRSFTSTSAAATVNLTGGFFLQGASAKTAVQFDGQAAVPSTIDAAHPSQRLGVTLPANALNVPGLYALTAQNPGIPAGQAAMSAINVAVTPTSAMLPSGGVTEVSLGGTSQPSSIAMDLGTGTAVIAEQGANAVALVDVASRTVTATIPVGTAPTGVAVDDLLPHHLALVVNSGDNSVSVIDLSVPAVTKTISLAGFTPTTSHPVSIAINPETHRAIVANASTDLATVIDLVNTNPNIDPACTTAPCPLVTVGGTSTGYSTGGSPEIGIDTELNWAVVTPGGAGSINIVDLGFGSPNPGSGGRAPAVIASVSLSTTVQGVGVDSETHTALFTDFNSGNVTTYSLLDNTVSSVTNFGAALTLPKESAAAVNPLQNLGIAINSAGSGTASVIDLGNHNVLQTVTGLTSQGGGTPGAVALDPATNEALVVNSVAGTFSAIPLGASSPKPLQILESNPSIAFTSGSPLSLTINGMGFGAGSVVLLDGTQLSGAAINPNGREIQVSVPASMLASARRFAVQVENTSSTPVSVSNVEPLTIVQAVPVGTVPAGVAVDPDRDLAVVTNSGSGDISLVSIAPPSNSSPQSLGPTGVIGSPLPAHLNPRAVAVDPRLGLAVVANYDSNDLSLVDYSDVNMPAPYAPPAVPGCSASTTCTGPAGVAFNQDTNTFLVTDTNIGAANSDVAFGTITAPTASSAASIANPGTPQPVDQTPGDVAIAPSFDPFDPVNNPNPALTYAAIASAGQTSVIDFLNIASELVVGRATGVVQPAGVVYDSLNHVFIASDSLNNNIVMIDPLTFVPVTVRGGFNPSSIAYNSQTSTIVTVNGATGTVSVLDYVCPPLAGQPACTAPQVRETIGLVGSQISPTAPIGPKTIDIDPLLNLAVLVDSENNRVLLVPLPY